MQNSLSIRLNWRCQRRILLLSASQELSSWLSLGQALQDSFSFYTTYLKLADLDSHESWLRAWGRFHSGIGMGHHQALEVESIADYNCYKIDSANLFHGSEESCSGVLCPFPWGNLLLSHVCHISWALDLPLWSSTSCCFCVMWSLSLAEGYSAYFLQNWRPYCALGQSWIYSPRLFISLCWSGVLYRELDSLW